MSVNVRASTAALVLIGGIAGRAVGVQAPESASAPGDRPNILLITADDLGPQLGAYGDSMVATPYLDAFARGAVLFENAWVTQATCSASRSSLFTGLYPHTNGHYGLTTTGSELHPHLWQATLPRVLRDAGYRTGILGKLHVEPESEFPWDYRSRPARDTRHVRGMALDAEAFMSEEAGRPFFLVMSYSDPHPSFGDECRECGFPPQVDGLPEVAIQPGPGTLMPFQAVDSPTQRRRTANYLNSVSRLDTGVGLVLKALERLGIRDRTIVVFLGDHGPPFQRGKLSSYDVSLRVPFIVRWPGVSVPGTRSTLVSSLDVFPTLLEAAGHSPVEGLQGQSLGPALEDAEAGGRTYLYGEYHLHTLGSFFPTRTVRTERFHLIHNLGAGSMEFPALTAGGDRGLEASREEANANSPAASAWATFESPPEYELYDLRADPHEWTNLADNEDFAAVLNELKRELERWRRDTEDPLLEPGATGVMAARFARPPRPPWEWLAVPAVLLLVFVGRRWWVRTISVPRAPGG